MEINVTITITAPEDGATPVIKVNTSDVKVAKTPAKPRTLKPIKENAPVRHTPTLKKEINYFNGKPRAMQQRSCLYCGTSFLAKTHNQKFDTKKCKDRFNYKAKLQEAKKPALKKIQKKAPNPSPATAKEKRMQVPSLEMSKDPFYIQQLQKAGKNHGKAYSRYISESSL